MTNNNPENWVEGIAELAEKMRLEQEYPYINVGRLGFALGVCLVILVVATLVM